MGIRSYYLVLFVVELDLLLLVVVVVVVHCRSWRSGGRCFVAGAPPMEEMEEELEKVSGGRAGGEGGGGNFLGRWGRGMVGCC